MTLWCDQQKALANKERKAAAKQVWCCFRPCIVIHVTIIKPLTRPVRRV